MLLTFFLTRALASAPEPYPPLSGGSFSGPAQPYSPDPLVQYVYPASVDVNQLQIFPVPPVTAALSDGTLESSFPGWETLTGAAPSVLAKGPGGIVVDFGAELPAWVELDSPDLSPADLPLLVLGTSEYNVVDIIGTTKKQGTPVAYNGTYRLETNKELYEGVRYAFISLSAAPARPFHITAFRAVVQAKPVNYTGSYAGDARTTRVYYAAAYTVRANLEKDYMGAILEDRGDRISWAGDAHVAQATALAVFGNWWDVRQNLAVTGKSQNGIASYSLYFASSVMDYFDFSHDLGTLGQYFDEVERILRGYFSTFNGTTSLAFYGWDDRLGSGFQEPTKTPEAQWDFRLLQVKLLARWGAMQTAVGNATNGAAFAAMSDSAWAWVQAALAAAAPGGAPWWSPLGVHAAGEALTTQRASDADVAAIIAGRFNDTTSACSLSNFNQYWLLNAMAAAGALDRGLAMVDLCWGPELDMGGTTFWEISSPDWAAFTAYGDAVPNGENGYTSLCHPWSAGPSAWLAAHALGVSRELPGSPWGDVRVAPHVSPAMRAEGGPLLLRGEVPLGLGVAGVEVGAGGEVAVALPPGTSATLLLSEALLRAVCGGACPGGLPASVVLLGRDGPRGDPRWARSEALRWARRGAAALPADYAPPLLEAADGSVGVRGAAAALRLEGAAHFTVKLFQEGAAATPPPPPPAHRAGAPFPPPTWRAPFLGADRLTRGDWVGVYGRDGGVLWGLGAAANGDKAFLPPWVASVTPRYAFLRGAWADGANVTDRRAPQNPNDPTGPRSVGYLTDSMGHDPTFAVDVALGASGAPPFFTVALYAVDWDSRGRRGTVALLDGATLDALSPIQGVSDYTEGVWLRWNVSGAFRLRVSQTRGDNAPITALLFN